MKAKTLTELKNRGEDWIFIWDSIDSILYPVDEKRQRVIDQINAADSIAKLTDAYEHLVDLVGKEFENHKLLGSMLINREQNDKFGMDADKLIRRFFDDKLDAKLKSAAVESEADQKISTKIDEIKAKVEDLVKIDLKKLILNSENYLNSIASEAKKLASEIESLDPCKMTQDEIDEVNALTDLLCTTAGCVKGINDEAKDADKADNKTSAKTSTKQLPKPPASVNDSKSKKTEVPQQQAAYSIANGFNIGNFIRQNTPNAQVVPGMSTVQQVINNSSQPVQQHVHKLPHETCGLTDQQMIEEVDKHFKLIQGLPTYPLFDLLNNPLLKKKMKELDCKQRANNPFLTQVNINEYIDVPELLAKYNLAFTMPCNDKKFVIMVLYGNIPVVDPNCGCVSYPLHIFKAKLTGK